MRDKNIGMQIAGKLFLSRSESELVTKYFF
jgi:hypothetical protein